MVARPSKTDDWTWQPATHDGRITAFERANVGFDVHVRPSHSRICSFDDWNGVRNFGGTAQTDARARAFEVGWTLTRSDVFLGCDCEALLRIQDPRIHGPFEIRARNGRRGTVWTMTTIILLH